MKHFKLVLASVITTMFSVNAIAAVPGCILTKYPDARFQENGVVVKAPDIAEDGTVVSVGIEEVNDIPAGVHVREISFYNEFRTDPVATFSIGPRIKENSINTRVRLRESSNIYAVAVLSNGDVVTGQSYVKVTIGGCGGGSHTTAVSKAARVCSVK